MLLAGLNLWLVCVAWPWLFGSTPTGAQWLVAALPLGVLLLATLRLTAGRQGHTGHTGRLEAWLLLAAFPCGVGACVAMQHEAVNRHALGPLALATAVVSLWAYGVASLWALDRGAPPLRARVRDVVPQPWDVPPTPAPRLQLPLVLVGALGALSIALWAPAWGGMARMRQHWGGAAVEGTVLTQVVALGLAVYLLAAMVGGGIRTSRSPELPASIGRFVTLMALALIMFAVHQVVRQD